MGSRTTCNAGRTLAADNRMIAAGDFRVWLRHSRCRARRGRAAGPQRQHQGDLGDWWNHRRRYHPRHARTAARSLSGLGQWHPSGGNDARHTDFGVPCRRQAAQPRRPARGAAAALESSPQAIGRSPAANSSGPPRPAQPCGQILCVLDSHFSEEDLQRLYGGVGGSAYQKVLAEIERRLAGCPALHPNE